MRTSTTHGLPIERPHITERDGETVIIRCCPIEFWANLVRTGDTIRLDRLSLDGSGPNRIGSKRRHEMAQQFMEDQGARQLVVTGTTRSTGANPGRSPKITTFRRKGR